MHFPKICWNYIFIVTILYMWTRCSYQMSHVPLPLSVLIPLELAPPPPSSSSHHRDRGMRRSEQSSDIRLNLLAVSPPSTSTPSLVRFSL